MYYQIIGNVWFCERCFNNPTRTLQTQNLEDALIYNIYIPEATIFLIWNLSIEFFVTQV